jgi:hypothetical protein
MGEDIQFTDRGGGDDDDDDIDLSMDRSFSSAMGKFLSPERRSLLQLIMPRRKQPSHRNKHR